MPRQKTSMAALLAAAICLAVGLLRGSNSPGAAAFAGATHAASRPAAAARAMLLSRPHSGLRLRAGSNAATRGVQLPPMESGEPALIAFAILRYLDEEWIEQPVHHLIGEAVGRIYKESRLAGDNDLITVVAKLAHGLKEMWEPAGFREAFEGPIEIANRAAELLMLRLGHNVLSFGPSHSELQAKMLYRLREYEGVRRSIIEAVGTAH